MKTLEDLVVVINHTEDLLRMYKGELKRMQKERKGDK
tara:strand:+ start:487 stop:597 length:111 start_codon:yes stop_codon:yes gene_type:complete